MKSRVTNSTSQATIATVAPPGFSTTTATARSSPSCPSAYFGRMLPAITSESSASKIHRGGARLAGHPP